MRRSKIVLLSLSVGVFFLLSACAIGSNAKAAIEGSQSASAISSAREPASLNDKSAADFSESVTTTSESLPPVSTVSSKDVSASEKAQPMILLELPILCTILDGDGLPAINAELQIPQILEGNFFHKSKSDGSYHISENDVGQFYAGSYPVLVTVMAGNGKQIQESITVEFDQREDDEPYVIKLSARLTSPPEDVRPTHDNIVLVDSTGASISDVWITLKRNSGTLAPAAGYADEAYGYTDQKGTFIWWNALPGDYICTVYRSATYDLNAKLGSFPFNIKDRNHSYEYTFKLDVA